MSTSRDLSKKDVDFLEKLLEEGNQVVDSPQPDRKSKVLDVLERVIERVRDRFGPTKDLLLSLREICLITSTILILL